MNLELKGVTAAGDGFGWRCKQTLMDVAEVIDALRVFPRLIMAGYGFWMVRVTDWIIRWYEQLPSIERTAQVTAFVTVVLPGVFGLSCYVYRIYADGGRNWDACASNGKNSAS